MLIDMSGGPVALNRTGRAGRPSAAPRTDALKAAKDFRGTIPSHWLYRLSAEAEFLDVIGTKVLRLSFPPCYSQSPLRLDFTPPPPPPPKKIVAWNWFVNIVYGETSSLRIHYSMPRSLNEIVRPWIRLQPGRAYFPPDMKKVNSN